MSAWIVSKEHIDLMVAAALKVRMEGLSRDALGQMLWDANYKSINARYRKFEDAPEYRFDAGPREINVVSALKQIDCYEYQTCEFDGWKDSKAFEFCQSLRAALIGELPGYDDAPWGV
jgi:hypothetical protein